MTDRIPLDHLTSDQYDELCYDLDRYEEVQGEMNERAIDLTRRAETAEKELREAQWRHEDAERRLRIQRERAERAEAAVDAARQLHAQTCPHAQGAARPPAFTCSMCTALTAPARETT